MIKLIAVEPKNGYKLLLRFSDESWGVHDFSVYAERATKMTTELRDPVFFARHYLELGALAWPNGFDLSAGSLHKKLQEAGELHYNNKVA